MPLTQAQIDAIDLIINGDPEDEGVVHLEKELNKIVATRDHLFALLQIHNRITDANATSIIGDLKLNAKNAAQTIVTLLS